MITKGNLVGSWGVDKTPVTNKHPHLHVAKHLLKALLLARATELNCAPAASLLSGAVYGIMVLRKEESR